MTITQTQLEAYGVKPEHASRLIATGVFVENGCSDPNRTNLDWATDFKLICPPNCTLLPFCRIAGDDGHPVGLDLCNNLRSQLNNPTDHKF